MTKEARNYHKLQSALYVFGELKPDFPRLLKRFPILAPALFSLACTTTSPANSEIPPEPTPVALTLPPSDTFESELVVEVTQPISDRVPTITTAATLVVATPSQSVTAEPLAVVSPKPSETAPLAPEQAATPELTVSPESGKAILRIVANIINVRNYPSTETTSSVIAQLRKDQVVDIIGKASNGWWEVRLADGTTGFVTNGSQYVVAENTANVPTVSNPDRPTPAPTPTRQETTVTKEWVIINTELLSFSSPGRGQLDIIVEPGKYTIIEKDGWWLRIIIPKETSIKILQDDGSLLTKILPESTSVWVGGINQTVESETGTVTIQPTNPNVVQMPGTPETTSELFTTSIFDGMNTPDGVVVATGGLDLTSAARRTSYGSNLSQITESLIVRVENVDGITYGAIFAPGGMRTYEVGRVVSHRTIAGGIEVTIVKVDGTTVVRLIPSQYGVAFYSQSPRGAGNLYSGGFGPISPSWFPKDVLIGVGPELVFLYQR